MKNKMIEQINKKDIPKVSIGMPVYNGEKFIREAIDSLLAQTFSDFELIISDNCSTDKTQEICKEYASKDPRVKYLRQIENIGIVANFEYVLNIAIAKYFMWAACDDIWSTDWIMNLYGLLEKSKVGAAFGRVLPVNQESKQIPHIATKKTFRLVGNVFFRRLRFYLQFEGDGKANLFHSLFLRNQISELKISSYSYDYLVIYSLLSKISFESTKSVYFYKRNYPTSSGNLPNLNKTLFFKIMRLVFPFPKTLIKDYLGDANFLEKLAMILLLPCKFLLAYVSIMHSLMIRNFS